MRSQMVLTARGTGCDCAIESMTTSTGSATTIVSGGMGAADSSGSFSHALACAAVLCGGTGAGRSRASGIGFVSIGTCAQPAAHASRTRVTSGLTAILVRSLHELYGLVTAHSSLSQP